MASFKVETEQKPGELLIRPIGDLDLAAFDEVDDILSEAQLDGNHRVVVDLRSLDFIDSTGIKLLLQAHARAKDVGNELCLVRGNPQFSGSSH